MRVGSIFQIFVGYACQTDNFFGKRFSRIYQRRELFSFSAVLESDSSDFDYTFGLRVESGSFQIERRETVQTDLLQYVSG